MRNVTELFHSGMAVMDINIHPDDYVIHTNLLYALRALQRRRNITTHNITLTKGEATTKNYHPDSTFTPSNGDREAEGRRGAARMGFASYEQLAGIDGQLERSRPWLVPRVAQLLVARKIDMVLALDQFGHEDSPDHAVGNKIALEAAQRAHSITGRPIGILAIRADGQGQWLAEATPNSMTLAHQAAEDNTSQFRYADALQQPQWPMTSSGRAMHPYDLQELLRYPVQHDATYDFTHLGDLAALQSTGRQLPQLALAGEQ